LPSESTLSFTSPTLVRTNFLVAQAVVPPRTNAAIGIAANRLRIPILLMGIPTRNSVVSARRDSHSGLERSVPCRARERRADASPDGGWLRRQADTDGEARRRSAARRCCAAPACSQRTRARPPT